MTQTWFITGSSRGLGRALTQAALETGDRVAASAANRLTRRSRRGVRRAHPPPLPRRHRRPGRPDGDSRRPPPSGSIGRHREQCGLCQRLADREHRRRGFPCPVRDQLLGRLQRVQGGDPSVAGAGKRDRHADLVDGGTGRWLTRIASYQAAKFAIDGFSRVLQAETAPFGVKVMVVEPSGFRTDWAGSSMTVHDIPEPYAPTVGAMHNRYGRAPGAPPATRGAPRRSSYRCQTPAHPLPLASRGTPPKDRSGSTKSSSTGTADGTT